MRGLVQVRGGRARAPSPSLLASGMVPDALGDASSWDSPRHRPVLEPFSLSPRAHLSPRDAGGPLSSRLNVLFLFLSLLQAFALQSGEDPHSCSTHR